MVQQVEHQIKSFFNPCKPNQKHEPLSCWTQYITNKAGNTVKINVRNKLNIRYKIILHRIKVWKCWEVENAFLGCHYYHPRHNLKKRDKLRQYVPFIPCVFPLLGKSMKVLTNHADGHLDYADSLAMKKIKRHMNTWTHDRLPPSTLLMQYYLHSTRKGLLCILDLTGN